MAHSASSTTLLNTDVLKTMENARFAIAYTEWNEAIISEMRAGCARIAEQTGAVLTDELMVPGSFELPFACRMLWDRYENSKEAPEAIIALGAVIRGGTPHFEYVCKAATEGILQLNLMLPIPVIFGVLTLDTEEQAWERLGGIHGHKGEEAAITALKMIYQGRKLSAAADAE